MGWLEMGRSPDANDFQRFFSSWYAYADMAKRKDLGVTPKTIEDERTIKVSLVTSPKLGGLKTLIFPLVRPGDREYVGVYAEGIISPSYLVPAADYLLQDDWFKNLEIVVSEEYRFILEIFLSDHWREKGDSWPIQQRKYVFFTDGLNFQGLVLDCIGGELSALRTIRKGELKEITKVFGPVPRRLFWPF